MNNVLEVIDSINKINNDFFSTITGCESKEYFLNGGCLDFVRIFQSLYKDAIIMIKYDKSHVCVSYEGFLYDASGVVEDTENYDIATNDDLFYMEKYSNNNFKPLNVADRIINMIGEKKQTR